MRVQSSAATVEDIVADGPDTGASASPGEEYRLVLGIFRNTPTPAAAVLGADFASPVASVMRFRCILHYSPLNSEWSIVAINVGAPNSGPWHTNSVK